MIYEQASVTTYPCRKGGDDKLMLLIRAFEAQILLCIPTKLLRLMRGQCLSYIQFHIRVYPSPNTGQRDHE